MPLAHPSKLNPPSNKRSLQNRFFGTTNNFVDSISLEHRRKFMEDGFVVIPSFISPEFASQLVERYEPLFRGEFTTGVYPDEWHWRQGLSLPNVTRGMCNAWKCDPTIASLVLSREVGEAAAILGGWQGTRVAQDDLWMKPPKEGKEISFHTDTSYIPWPEVTCWIALDDVTKENGTLEYVKGSHRWRKYKDQADTSGFHAPSNNYKTVLERAAAA